MLDTGVYNQVSQSLAARAENWNWRIELKYQS
jgi:hypothetical protein